ncbi:MAG: sugar ABC transporter permease [Deinococcus sp.]|nr:sugar ABC transporter permease [Deinococcus sp.]
MYERGWRRALTYALFLGPSVVGVAVFLLGPILASLVLAFMNWDLLTPPRFAGLANFQALLQDPEFWAALQHTLTFLAGYIPLVMLLGLLVAVALNNHIPGQGLYRALYFLPVVTAWVAVALVWKWLLNPSYGLVNNFLGLWGLQGPAWLFDPNWAMPAVILTSVWKDTGFVMAILLAGLQGIPREYYEAASIDGVFDQVYVMTGGGPAGATTVLVERIVKNAFSYSRMGYAAAMSWVLFVLIFLTTLLLSRARRGWSA